MHASPNPLAILELLKTSDEKGAAWEMDLEVRADSNLRNPPLCISKFKTQEKDKTIRRRQTETKLFTPLLVDAPPDFGFATNASDVDREAGYVTHELDFQWKTQESTPSVAREFTVKKSEFGMLRLPWIPAADKRPSADTFKGRLDQAGINLTNTDWSEALRKLEPESVRYRIVAPSNDTFTENKKRFKDEIVVTVGRLKSKKSETQTELQMDNMELKTATESKKQELTTRIGELTASIASHNSEIIELDKRVSALNELGNKFDSKIHDKQFDAYKHFQKASKTLRLGYEVAIQLREFNEGEVVHPPTKFYLIESDFSEEQQ